MLEMNLQRARDNKKGGEVGNHFLLRCDGARFENTPAIETLDPDITSSLQSESVTDGSVAGDKPIKTDRRR
jgi:hypothetical protein